MRRLGVALPAFVLVACGPGNVVNVDPTMNVQGLIDNLVPGDVMQFSPGVYNECLEIERLHGNAGARITLTGPESGPRAIIVGSNCVPHPMGFAPTMIRIQDSSYLDIRNLELDGQSMEVVGLQAGYGTPPVHNVTVENMFIHDNDATSQFTGISVFTTSWDWVMRNNRMERVGLGLYLGNSDGADPFIRGVIEGNVVINPKGYGMQIKHQFPRINVTGMPQTDSVTYIRHNVFIKETNSVTGNAARPNLLIGDLPQSGIGTNDRYEIYGNFLYQNNSGTEGLFQGEGNFAFHDNVLFNSFNGGGMLIQPHNGDPREIAVYRNTIVSQTSGILLFNGLGSATQTVLGNAVYAPGMTISAANESDNVTGTLNEAAMALGNTDRALGTLDLYPRAGALLGDNVDYSRFSAHTDWDLDFNGDMHDPARRGAYAGDGANPGWMLAAANKPIPGMVTPPPADAGTRPPPIDAGFDDSGVAIDAGQVAQPDATTPVNPDATVDPQIDAGSTADAGAGNGGGNNGGGNVGGMPDTSGGRAASGGCVCVEPADRSEGWVALATLGFLALRRRSWRAA